MYEWERNTEEDKPTEVEVLDRAKKQRRSKKIPIEDMIQYRQEGLTHQQIADRLGCQRTTVSERLKKANLAGLGNFREYEAEVLSYHRRRILDFITDEDIEKANLQQKATSYAIFLDKERLLSGQTTANLGTIHANIHKLKQEEKEEKNIEEKTVSEH